MGKRLIVAAPQPGYASRLALYLKEREPDTEIAAFTQNDALALYLQERRGAELIVVHQSMLAAVSRGAGGAARIVVLTEGGTTGEYEGLPAIAQYQPLSRLAADIRRLTASVPGRPAEGTALWAVCSAGGGAGKTTLALNAAKQAAERGYSVLYLNLEALNATGLLLESGEPDALTRLLYELAAHPEAAAARIGRLGARRSAIGAGYVDAPDSPAELLALTPERLELLLGALGKHGGFDLIVADVEGGFGAWQLRLLELSARVLWVGADDAQLMRKLELALRIWTDRLRELPGKSVYVLNKALGEPAPDLWRPPGGEPWLPLPYIPAWKHTPAMGALLASAAFAGGVDRLLDKLGYGSAGRAGRGAADSGAPDAGGPAGEYPPFRRRDDDLLRERAAAGAGGYSC